MGAPRAELSANSFDPTRVGGTWRGWPTEAVGHGKNSPRVVLLPWLERFRGFAGIVLLIACCGAALGRSEFMRGTMMEKGSIARWIVSAVAGSAAACGSVSQESPDARRDVDATESPPCDVSKPWGAPRLLGNVNSADIDTAPRLSSDELTIYFATNRSDPSPSGAGYEIMMAERPAITSSFAPPVLVPGDVNTSGYDADPMISADGLSLFFASGEPDGQRSIGVWLATRASTAMDFSAPTALAAVNSDAWDDAPFLGSDGTELVFRSFSSGNGDLMRSMASLSSGFGSPTPITELNTQQVEGAPLLSADGKTIYFASDRTDGGAAGGYGIWMARRSTPQSAFEPPTLVSELDTTANEAPGWASADGCRLYLSSDRGGNYDLYVAERPQ